jgi:flagellar hook-basal body complex protein FliE
MIETFAPIQAIAATASTQIGEVANDLLASRLSFDQILRQGIDATNTKIATADKLVADFAIDGSIPAHQVTFALEEARLSLELMIQVRNRLVEGYQQIMNMQV